MLGKRLPTPCRPQFSVTEVQQLSRKSPIWGDFKNFEGLGLQPQILVRRRNRTGKRLPHHPSVHAELRRNPRDRPDPKLMLPTELLEQIHFGFPVHARSPEPSGTTVG